MKSLSVSKVSLRSDFIPDWTPIWPYSRMCGTSRRPRSENVNCPDLLRHYYLMQHLRGRLFPWLIYGSPADYRNMAKHRAESAVRILHKLFPQLIITMLCSLRRHLLLVTTIGRRRLLPQRVALRGLQGRRCGTWNFGLRRDRKSDTEWKSYRKNQKLHESWI